MKTSCDFIELYNMAGNLFYGSFSCPEAAKPRLNELRKKGELLAIDHAVLMYEYKYDSKHNYIRTGIRVIHYKNGWKIKK